MATPTTTIGPFLGMNNRLPDTRLGTDEGDYLLKAVNVDVTGAGTLRRRAGTKRVIQGERCHSFFGVGARAFFVAGSTLQQLTGTWNAPVVTALRTGLTPGLPVSYCEANGEVFYTNGEVFGRVGADGAHVQDNALPTPQAPFVTVLAGGGLPAGEYQVSVTHIAASGEQSGASLPVQVSVGENCSLVIAAPGLLPARALGFNVFVTPPNGDVLYRVGRIASGALTLSAPTDGGEQCPTRFLAPLPAGQIVRWFNGRLLCAQGSLLFYSDTYNLGLYDPSRHYIPFPEPITVVEPCQNGVYVTADQTYWLQGADIAQAEVLPVLPYGAVPGSGVSLPDRNMVAWYSPRGLVTGTQDGQATNVQERAVIANPATSAAILFREEDGLKQFIATLANPGQPMAASRSFLAVDTADQ